MSLVPLLQNMCFLSEISPQKSSKACLRKPHNNDSLCLHKLPGGTIWCRTKEHTLVLMLIIQITGHWEDFGNFWARSSYTSCFFSKAGELRLHLRYISFLCFSPGIGFCDRIASFSTLLRFCFSPPRRPSVPAIWFLISGWIRNQAHWIHSFANKYSAELPVGYYLGQLHQPEAALYHWVEAQTRKPE